MNCPNCAATALTPQDAGGITIDRCPSCQGMWLDALELEKLLESRPQTLLQDDSRFKSTPASNKSKVCPSCGGTSRLIALNSLHKPGTVLDSCTVCFGTWLDAGELSRLAGGSILEKIRTLWA